MIERRKYISLFLFILPALLFYFVFRIIPTIGGFIYSITDWNGINTTINFVGIKNYKELLHDLEFIKSLNLTFKYAFLCIVLHNCIALFLAVMIEKTKIFKGFFRTVFFLPNMVSMLVGGYMWTFVFSKAFVAVGQNTFLKFLDQSWFGNSNLAFLTVIIVSTWVGMGYNMLIYIAALQGVPEELVEAAQIDGSNPITLFFRIKLPLIMHSVTICTFLTLRSAFKVFDLVLALTNGGPAGTTEVAALNIYLEAFSKNSRYGYGNAKATVLFFIVLLLAIIQMTAMRKMEVEQ